MCVYIYIYIYIHIHSAWRNVHFSMECLDFDDGTFSLRQPMKELCDLPWHMTRLILRWFTISVRCACVCVRVLFDVLRADMHRESQIERERE